MGFFNKISEGLRKTREGFSKRVEEITNSFTAIDDDLFEELEEALILADVGAVTSGRICAEVKARIKKTGITDAKEVKGLLKQVIAEMLSLPSELNISTKPSVVLIIGVNGVGKTTTIGKLAHQLKDSGKTVLLGAADTFRAAAIEQLQIWADRAETDLIKHAEGADPAAVVYDAVAAGKARNVDVIICDTAGRLHNKKNLMDELAKISRVIKRELPNNDLEILLVLDGTTGQNALNQARLFKEAADITGIVLTKLDGTAKGGVVIGIVEELKIPVKYIGVGEKLEDLRPFDATDFANALFSEDNENAENAE